MTVRICAAPGCEALAFDGSRCPDCAAELSARAAAFDKARRKDPHRRIYKTARWERERKAFLAAHPACADCAELGIARAAELVDHVIPVRLRPDLAFDARNWRALCWSCHSRKTARQDSGFAPKGGGSKIRPPATGPAPNTTLRRARFQSKNPEGTR